MAVVTVLYGNLIRTPLAVVDVESNDLTEEQIIDALEAGAYAGFTGDLEVVFAVVSDSAIQGTITATATVSTVIPRSTTFVGTNTELFEVTP